MDIVNAIETVGLPSAFVAVMVWLYRSADKRHTEERSEWRKDSGEMHNKTNKNIENTNIALKELTKAISDSKNKVNEK